MSKPNKLELWKLIIPAIVAIVVAIIGLAKPIQIDYTEPEPIAVDGVVIEQRMMFGEGSSGSTVSKTITVERPMTNTTIHGNN